VQFCRAQIPQSASFNLGPAVAPETQLWNLSGDYTINIDIESRNGLSIPVQISFSLVQDTAGKLTGSPGAVSGLIFNNDGNSAFAIGTTVSGKVTGSLGFARARFTVHFAGNGQFGGRQNLEVTGSITVDAETDPSTGQLTGRVRNFTADIGNGFNHISGKSDFAMALPSGVDGSWNLTVNVAGLQKFNGIGVITVPQGPYGINLNGHYNPVLDVIDLKAKGAGGVPGTFPGTGLNARVILDSTFDTLQVDGKLFGQKVSFNVTTATD
jgi:hypothetical protein